MYGLCKQNYPSVMEEVHRSIDCGKGRNDQKSLSYSRDEMEFWKDWNDGNGACSRDGVMHDCCLCVIYLMI